MQASGDSSSVYSSWLLRFTTIDLDIMPCSRHWRIRALFSVPNRQIGLITPPPPDSGMIDIRCRGITDVQLHCKAAGDGGHGIHDDVLLFCVFDFSRPSSQFVFPP